MLQLGAIGEALSLPPQELTTFAKRARAHIQKAFTLEAMTSATLELYARLLARP